MAATVTYVLTDLAKDIAALVVGKVDAGTTNPQGKLRIVDGGDVTLVDIDLQDPSFAFDSGATYAVQGTPLNGTAVATGSATKAKFLDRDDNVVFEGPATATGGGGFAELDKLSIETGDTVTLTSGSFTQPSS